MIGSMPNSSAMSHGLLKAVLEGLQAQKNNIDENIARVQSLVGIVSKRRGRPPKQEQTLGGGGGFPGPFRRRKFSLATRKKMAEAQRKRWAEIKGR